MTRPGLHPPLGLAMVLLLAAAGACSAAPSSPLDYAARDLDGQEVHLASLRGHPALLNVWATWCVPCRHEVPQLERLHREYGARGLRVIGISVDGSEEEDTVRRFAIEAGITYTLWRDPQSRALSTFSAISLPLTVLVDREGAEVWRSSEPISADNPVLLAALARVLAT